ncbi:MAG: hypothetical protein QOH23_774 [Gaiellaceae bacterium]|jgi:hypothetical protein|nr:hypothetical protein [Gaiellaceae bacterium]
MRYSMLVDGERVGRLDSEDEVRSWIAKYRDEHAEDDPDAVHVQVVQQGSLGWLTGGKLLDRERFF